MMRVILCYLVIGMMFTAYDLTFTNCRSLFRGFGHASLLIFVGIVGWPYFAYRIVRDLK